MKIIEALGGVLLRMCSAFGFYKATLLFSLIAVAISFLIIRQNYKNVIVSLLIQDEYYKIPSLFKNDPSTAQVEQTKYLLGSGYSVLSGVGIIVVKLLLSIMFALGCMSDLVAEYVAELPVDVTVCAFKLYDSCPIACMGALIGAVTASFSTFYVFKMLSYGLLDNGMLGTIAVVISGVACMVLPIGGGFVYLVITLVEFCLTVFNLSVRKDKNMEFTKVHIHPYVAPKNNTKNQKTKRR